MFGYFFSAVTDYLGDGFFRSMLWVSLLVSGAAVLSYLGIALLWPRADEKSAAVARALEASLALAKIFGAVALTVFLIISLRARSIDFGNSYGRVTETNREAVQSIWGSPHDQHNLMVRHYVEEEKIIEQLKTEENPFGGEDIPAEVERRYRKKVTREVPQDSIIQNDHQVTINMNYRKKGSAFYTTFEDEADFNYTVKNRSDLATSAAFSFPLPISSGMIHGVKVEVGGEDWSDKARMSGSEIAWDLKMEPGQEHKVRIVYKSRGMDYWAFRVWGMEPLTNFRLRVNIPGYDVENNPIGCMSPTSVTHDDKGTTLEWKLDRAVTNLGMGVILPARPQPGHHEANLLRQAPAALFLFMVLIGLVRHLAGARLALLPIALLGVAAERFFSLLAYCRALDASIALSLPAVSLILIGAAFLFLRRYGDNRSAVFLQTSLFALLTLGYSLCIIETNHTDWLLQSLYTLLLLGLMLLTARHQGQKKTQASP